MGVGSCITEEADYFLSDGIPEEWCATSATPSTGKSGCFFWRKKTRVSMPGGTADAKLAGVKKFPFLPKLDPLGVKTGLELAAGGLLALLLMRWFGM